MPSTTRHVHREGSSPGPPLSRVRRGGWSGGGSCLCPRRIYHRWLLLGFCTSATAPRRREAVSSHDPCREAAPMCSITRSPQGTGNIPGAAWEHPHAEEVRTASGVASATRKAKGMGSGIVVKSFRRLDGDDIGGRRRFTNLSREEGPLRTSSPSVVQEGDRWGGCRSRAPHPPRRSQLATVGDFESLWWGIRG